MTSAAEKSSLQQTGLYDPTQEHDACGVGFVAHIKGAKTHAIVTQALKILENLDHRGAVGADKLMGDGAGILIQLPDALYREEMAKQGVTCLRKVSTVWAWCSCLKSMPHAWRVSKSLSAL
jgi:glutamate synthase (NADPH) large chain